MRNKKETMTDEKVVSQRYRLAIRFMLRLSGMSDREIIQTLDHIKAAEFEAYQNMVKEFL